MEDLGSYFHGLFKNLPATRETRAYLSGLFSKQVSNPVDYSRESIVLRYADVRRTPDMETLQSIGDWVLWVDTVLPSSLEGHRDASHAVAQASYYRCYKLVNCSWACYEELADTLPTLVKRLGVVLGQQFVTTKLL